MLSLALRLCASAGQCHVFLVPAEVARRRAKPHSNRNIFTQSVRLASSATYTGLLFYNHQLTFVPPGTGMRYGRISARSVRPSLVNCRNFVKAR